MIQRLYANIAARLKAATPRERAGLAAIGAVGAIVAAASSFDWALSAADHERTATQSRANAEAGYARDSDSAAQERIATDTNKVWRWSIVEMSPVLAQARAVDMVQGLALIAGVAGAEVTPLDAEEETGALRTIRVRMTGDFEWGSFLSLLEAIENSDTSFFVEAVEVSASPDQAPRLSLTLFAPFIEDAPS